MMSLSTIGEDAQYLNDNYEGVKHLMIGKLFDLSEPYMTREYALKNNIFFKIFVNLNVIFFEINIYF